MLLDLRQKHRPLNLKLKKKLSSPTSSTRNFIRITTETPPHKHSPHLTLELAADKDTGAGKQQRKELTDAERIRLIRSKRRGGGGTVGIVDRSRKTCVVSCSEAAAAAACYSTDICITKPACLLACPPAPEPAGVYCYNWIRRVARTDSQRART